MVSVIVISFSLQPKLITNHQISNIKKMLSIKHLAICCQLETLVYTVKSKASKNVFLFLGLKALF